VSLLGVAKDRKNASRRAFRSNSELWQVFSGEDIKAALIAPGRPLVVVNIEKSERYLQWLFVDDDGAYAVETYKLDPPAGFVNPRSGLNLSELRKITRKARMPTNARVRYRIWSDYFDTSGG
jgi:hypothetical protein